MWGGGGGYGKLGAIIFWGSCKPLPLSFCSSWLSFWHSMVRQRERESDVPPFSRHNGARFPVRFSFFLSFGYRVIGFYVHASNIVLLLARKRKKEKRRKRKRAGSWYCKVWRCIHEIEGQLRLTLASFETVQSAVPNVPNSSSFSPFSFWFFIHLPSGL